MKFDSFINEMSPPDFNYGLLTVVPSSRYSSIMPWHIIFVENALLKETENWNIETIMDCTGNIGCDSILFRLLFPDAYITTIELDDETFEALQINMSNLKAITNNPNVYDIDVIHGDCLDYIYNSNNSLIFFDPPWNSAYKAKFMNLTLSGQDLGIIVNNVLKLKPNTLIVVKLPFNINYVYFHNQITKDLPNLTIRNYDIYTSSKCTKVSYVLSFIYLS